MAKDRSPLTLRGKGHGGSSTPLQSNPAYLSTDFHLTIETEMEKTRRHWFRFRLRTLLVMVMLLSVPLGWVGWELDQRRKEKKVVGWIEEMGGEVYFYSSFPIDERSRWGKTKDKWFGERVRFVNFNSPPVNDLSPLAELKNLEYIAGPRR